MFKPQDQALIRGSDRIVSIENTTHEIISTSGGDFQESDLQMWGTQIALTAKGVQSFPAVEEKPATKEQKQKALMHFSKRDAVQKALKELPKGDLKGHFCNNPLAWNRPEFWGMFEPEALLEAIQTGVPLKEPVLVGRISASCYTCDSPDMDIVTDGTSLQVAGAPCPYPEGMPPQEWELNVPSGVLIVENDLREFFPDADPGTVSVNSQLGKHNTTAGYAYAGLAHGFVGNSCPGVYEIAEGRYQIANSAWTEEGEEQPPSGEKVAFICTDLWWYSLCDSDELKRRTEGLRLGKGDYTEVQVKPGVYRFKHYLLSGDYDSSRKRLYTEIEWVRDPDPVVDHLAVYRNRKVNAYAYLQASVNRWPTLYGKGHKGTGWDELDDKERLKAWKRVGDHIFLTIGSGTDWHEGGFPHGKVDPTIVGVDPPALRGQEFWYPFAEGYGGLFKRNQFEPSFAMWLFRCLESILSFGIAVYTVDNEAFRDVVEAKDRMRFAARRYLELAEGHPKECDPEYVLWLSDKDRVERWIANFDLGPIQGPLQVELLEKKRNLIPMDATEVDFDGTKVPTWKITRKDVFSFPTKAEPRGFLDLHYVTGEVQKPKTFTARILGRLMDVGGEPYLHVELEGDRFYIPYHKYNEALTARSA